MRRFALLALSFTLGLDAQSKKKLSDEERIEILRGITAEYATAKVLIPRSRKALPIDSTGKYDKGVWDDAMKEFGPAARSGEQVQVTKITLEDDKVLLELNHGLKTGKKWYEKVEVGMGGSGSTAPVGRADQVATAGTTLQVKFPDKLHDLDAAKIKQILKPVLDFEKHSVTENYVDQLPEPIKNAIKAKLPIEGMDREQVMMALGKPVRKERRSVDGTDFEDWMYGKAPGKITFVTFTGKTVSKVKDSYAGLGGSTAAELPVQ